MFRCGDLTILLLGLAFHCFYHKKQKIATPQPPQAIAQRFCSILIYQAVHHRTNLTRTFKIEYRLPAGGTIRQEIRNGFLLFLCSDKRSAFLFNITSGHISPKYSRRLVRAAVFFGREENNLATTTILPRHAGEGETIASAICDCLDYGKNPEKTEGKYISAYECDPATVAEEFLLAKASYKAIDRAGAEKGNGCALLPDTHGLLSRGDNTKRGEPYRL